MITQPYVVDVIRETVIQGNDVLFKCRIPSFVADFVSVINWVDNDNVAIYGSDHYGKMADMSNSCQ